ncbi:kelch-like protein 10 [Haplochromis burtoni]|uniref:kelch-like protein 10 n=1 Tax=Haplochromis burtoni TaxID=8153 RepID=UPI0006C9E58A|nr:kelch-like protein 10 [Haplochromis burtoni]
MNSTCSTVFSELFLEGQLCDSVIRAGDVEFKIHRIILCNCSAYFRDLFCYKPLPSNKVYNFPTVSPKAMSLILEYAYTQSVVVTEDNVLELLVEADNFIVTGVIQACCDFLERKLCVNNCVSICNLAHLHNCPDLSGKAYLYILHHFEEVGALSLEFLQLSVQQLSDLIEKDELNVKQESTVFEAILRWINYSPVERGCDMPALLKQVRLLLMPTEYLVDTVSRNDLVSSSPACMNMVTTAIKMLNESNMERPLTQTRLPSEVLLAVGGWVSHFPSDKIELYNVRADHWVPLSWRHNASLGFYGCAYLNGCVYCIGGFDFISYSSHVRRFSLTSQTWTEVGSMHEERGFLSVATLNGCIYAMGGCRNQKKLKTAERYEPDTNQWTMIASMHKPRTEAGAATLHGKVYICGGLTGDEPLSCAESYNPDTNQWTLITPMETGRTGGAVVAYNDEIYVVGGFNGITQLRSVIAYDPRTRHWRNVAPMLHPRKNFGIAVLEDQLYVVGGFHNGGSFCNVECYDEKTNRWYIVSDKGMTQGAVSCCVLRRHPDLTAYLS